MNLLGAIEIDLSAKGVVEYKVPPCNRLWLPPRVLRTVAGGVLQMVEQDPAAIVAVSIGAREAQPLPFGSADSLAISFSGPFSSIFVQVVANPNGAAKLYLHTGTDVVIGYGNTEGLSPFVGPGANDSGSGVRFHDSHVVGVGLL